MTDQYPSQWANQPEPAVQPTSSTQPQPGYLAAVPRSEISAWSTRVRARLIDQGPTYLGLIIFYGGYLLGIVQLARSNGSTPDFASTAVAMIIGLSVMLASLPWVAYNRWKIAGRTGQSLGKRVTKIMLLGEDSKAPIGPGYAFIRDLVHILDALTLMGYLWPLWDNKKQTFADKIMNTIVVSTAPTT
jgi:uncharacterized RDD family membrane protein YckC